jgi:aminomuconate-semialdehyde/2-hydroxymuconate-6-semialdehyde dehydrogenase
MAADSAHSEQIAMKTLANYIDGKLRPPASGAYIESVEPATGVVNGKVPDSDHHDIDAAVRAAQQAFPGWSGCPARERADHLLRIADLIDRDADQLARAESMDQGKPITLARSFEIPRAAQNMRHFATAVLHAESQLHEVDGDAINYTLRSPRGVAGCISPWNLPLYLLTWKIAPALATGNTVVAKPSELTPVTAAMFGELCIEAGLPPGVLNIVQGLGTKAGAAIVAHPDVPTVSFTGGSATGKEIMKVAAPMLKRVSLELGGKNANLVFADADLDAAMDSAALSAFQNQGEICLCGSRLLVERPVYDRVLAGLIERAGALQIGDPLVSQTQQGALVSKDHLAKVSRYVDMARDLGGHIHCGGGPPKSLPHRCRNGFFYQPTVITGLDHTCPINQEEIFGPVVTVTPFDTEQEALAIANGTEYGLAAMVWTSDVSRAHRVSAKIDAGVVYVNCWMMRDLRTPLGGMKKSGVGREGGHDSLRFFTEPKNVCVRIASPG